jgi:hypothetical protein
MLWDWCGTDWFFANGFSGGQLKLCHVVYVFWGFCGLFVRYRRGGADLAGQAHVST